ncbi:MAG: SbmA/BacA-like family transporter [Pseudotabrizicola sp.]|nr:SbmA/BacA-like family transporter [Pseudotabrizicola sp.]
MWRLSKIATSGRDGRFGLFLYCAILGLSFCSVWLSLQMIAWNKAFYDALEQMDAAEAARQIGVFFLIVSGVAGSNLVQAWLRDDLRIRWRRRLTERALDVWVDGKAYWHLRAGFTPEPIDNPDQRVAQDCDAFVGALIRETLDLVSSSVALFSYVALLWSLSSFALSFTLWGTDIVIPRYMFWAAFVYVAISSVITHMLGKRLKSRLFVQEKREADFRHALIQLRENAEIVARSGAEAAERRRFDTLFDALRQNWRSVINQRFKLGLFTTPYTHTILRIPNFLAAPTYFAGAVTLGGMMQLGSAFGSVTQTLSWFIFSYRDLAAWAAVTDRLDGLFAAAADPSPMPGTPRALALRDGGGDLELRGVALFTPAGEALVPVPDFTLRKGQRLWLSGPSGQGKSTLLAAISGLWPYGRGQITVPVGRWLFVPQGGCLSPEGLVASLAAPDTDRPHSRAAMATALMRVGLADRIPMLDVAGPLSIAGLSQGQAQRVAMARVLLARPDVLLLDEATSALDPVAEQEMLALIRHALPDSSVICVAHRPPEALDITRRVVLGTPARQSTAAS